MKRSDQRAEHSAEEVDSAVSESRRVLSEPYANPCLIKKGFSRRALLGRTSAASVASLLVPSWAEMIFARRAYGAELNCKPANAGSVLPALLQFELSGGWNSLNSFVMGSQRDGGSFVPLPLAGYASFGLGGRIAPIDETRIDRQLGGPMVKDGPFLRGFLTAVTPEAMTKMSVAVMAARSTDDTASNLLNITQQAARVVSAGATKLTSIVGTGATDSFGFSRSVLTGIPTPAAGARVTSPETALALIDPGLMASRLSRQSVDKIGAALSTMSEAQLKAFQSKTMNEQQADLVRCGYIGARELLAGIDSARLDPRQDTVIAALPGNPLANVDETRTVTLAKFLTDGMASAASLQMGRTQDYDYHARSLVDTTAMSTAVGRHIGLVMQMAHMKGVPLFVLITSDGSASSGANDQPDAVTDLRKFSSEDETRSTTVMLAISGGNPGAAGTRPKMNHYQIGAFNAAGSIDNNYLGAVISQPELHGLVAIANYAAFAGRSEEFKKHLQAAGQQDFIQDNVQFLAFGK
jgi:hypothetical protein